MTIALLADNSQENNFECTICFKSKGCYASQKDKNGRLQLVMWCEECERKNKTAKRNVKRKRKRKK